MCGVGKRLSLSRRHQPCSRCQQVSFNVTTSQSFVFPNVSAIKPHSDQCGGNAPQTNKGPVNPFIWCWKEPGEEAYSSNPTFLFHSEVLFSSFTRSYFPGFLLAGQTDHEEKEVYDSKQFASFLRKWSYLSLSNQIYLSAECFEGVSGAACLSVCVISYAEAKNWWEVNSQKAPTPLLEGVNNAFGVIYLK